MARQGASSAAAVLAGERSDWAVSPRLLNLAYKFALPLCCYNWPSETQPLIIAISDSASARTVVRGTITVSATVAGRENAAVANDL